MLEESDKDCTIENFLALEDLDGFLYDMSKEPAELTKMVRKISDIRTKFEPLPMNYFKASSLNDTTF